MITMRIGVNAIPLTEGGGGTVLLGYLEVFRKLFPSLEFFVFASRPELVRLLAPIDVVTVEMEGGTSWAGRLLQQVTRVGHLASTYRCNLLLSTNSAVPACPIPQIVHHQNLWSFATPPVTGVSQPARLRPLLLRCAARHAIGASAANVFVSHYLRQAAEALYPETRAKNSVMYNGLSEGFIRAATEKLDAWQGEPTLVSLTSTALHKDNETAIQCLASLCSRAPTVPWK